MWGSHNCERLTEKEPELGEPKKYDFGLPKKKILKNPQNI